MSSQKLICQGCGFKSQKGGKCWDEYGMCMKCSKKHYKTLHCKCGATSNHVDAECWRNGMCGKCYRKYLNPKRFLPSQYKMCQCGERLVKLSYSKNRVYVGTNNYICTKCLKVYMFDSRHTVTMTGLCQKCYKSGTVLTIVDGLPVCEPCKKILK